MNLENLAKRSLNAHRIGHAVGQEDNNRSGWRTYNAKDVYGSSDQDRAYRVKMPSARYDEPDKYAEKYRMPGTLESYAEKKAKEKEEKVIEPISRTIWFIRYFRQKQSTKITIHL